MGFLGLQGGGDEKEATPRPRPPSPGQQPGQGAGCSPGRDGIASSGGLELRPIIIARRITAVLAVLWVQKRHVLVAGWRSWQPQAGFGCAGIWKLP